MNFLKTVLFSLLLLSEASYAFGPTLLFTDEEIRSKRWGHGNREFSLISFNSVKIHGKDIFFAKYGFKVRTPP